jgi:hypothetical protein
MSDRIGKTLKNKLKQFWGIKQTGNARARKMGFDDEQEYLAYLKHQMNFLKQWDKERDNKQKKYEKKAVKELQGEYKDFLKKLDAQLSSERSHANKMPVPTKNARKTPINKATVQRYANGDKELTFRFSFEGLGKSMLEYLSKDAEDIADIVSKNINDAIDSNPSLKQLVGAENTYTQALVYMTDMYDKTERPEPISTTFQKSRTTLITMMESKIKKYFEKYDEEHILLRELHIKVKTSNQLNGQGSATRTINEANKKMENCRKSNKV